MLVLRPAARSSRAGKGTPGDGVTQNIFWASFVWAAGNGCCIRPMREHNKIRINMCISVYIYILILSLKSWVWLGIQGHTSAAAHVLHSLKYVGSLPSFIDAQWRNQGASRGHDPHPTHNGSCLNIPINALIYSTKIHQLIYF
jgi:hypothetical protein